MSRKTEFIYLSQEDVINTDVDMPKILNVIEEVLSLHERDKVILPSKVVLDLGERERGRINAMPAYIGGNYEICGIKWIAGFPPNPGKYGIPRAHALIVLNDAEKGIPLAVMDGTYISAMRTGAVSGVGAKYLARPDSRIAGIIGCGVQAKTQIMAIKACVPSISILKCFDIRAETSNKLARWVQRNLNINCEVVKMPQGAVENSDIIITATVADEPIVKYSWLKEGSLFIHVGSYQEEEEEVILKVDKVVVDIWHEVLHRGTPLLAKLYNEGKIDEQRVWANIGEIITGKKAGRESETEKIYFSPLGLGSEDIGVAKFVFEEAKRKAIGQKLKLWDNPIFS